MLKRLASAIIPNPPAPATPEVGPLTVPYLRTVSPEYATVEARRRELHEAIQNLDAEESDLIQSGLYDKAEPSEPGALPPRVAALLGRDVVEARPSKKERMREIYTEKADLKEAYNVLGQELSRHHLAASALICDAVRDEYRSRVASVCRALVALYATTADLGDLADDLNTRNVAWSALVPMPFQACRPRDRNSDVALYLREAVRCGFIPADLVPKEIR